MTGVRSPVSIRRSSDRWEILRRHVQDGVPFTQLSLETGVGVRTLERWHAAVRHHGPAGLEAAGRSDRGTRRAVPDLVALVEGLALLRPRRSTATITRAAARVAVDRGWKPLSYSVVRDIVASLDPPAVTLAQDGPVAYRDKYELLWRHRAQRPNAVWQADHTELDILIRMPNGQPGR